MSQIIHSYDDHQSFLNGRWLVLINKQHITGTYAYMLIIEQGCPIDVEGSVIGIHASAIDKQIDAPAARSSA
jgi:hypothetical protein